MKSLLVSLLLLAVAHGFAPAQLPTRVPSSCTELTALGLRTAKRFISRRILRRTPKEEENSENMEVIMRDNDTAAVEDGAPVLTDDVSMQVFMDHLKKLAVTSNA